MAAENKPAKTSSSSTLDLELVVADSFRFTASEEEAVCFGGGDECGSCGDRAAIDADGVIVVGFMALIGCSVAIDSHTDRDGVEASVSSAGVSFLLNLLVVLLFESVLVDLDLSSFG